MVIFVTRIVVNLFNMVKLVILFTFVILANVIILVNLVNVMIQVNLIIVVNLLIIVAKKLAPGNLVPSRFSGQIRKVEARLGKLAKIRKVETN